MKRFLAYLSILISVILGIVIVAKPAVQGINGGYDYEGSKEFVYQIVNHGETIDDFDPDAFVDDSAVTKIAKEFETRLLSYDVEKYDIVIEGYDKIRVRFSAEDNTEYGYIANYLTADGNLSLVTYDGEVVFNNYDNAEFGETDAMFGHEDAYMVYKDSIYPGIVIPLADAKTFNEKAVKHAEEINVPNAEEGVEVSDEGNIYLWTRYNQDTDNFENANKNENIKNKLMLSFQYDKIFYEEKEEDYSSIVFYFNVEGIDEHTTADTIPWANIEEATERANYYMHLINASHLDQRVYLLSSNDVGANLETLVDAGMSLDPAASHTLIATVIVFGLILIVSTIFFRLNGAITAVTTILGSLFTLFVYNLIGATLSFPTILGFMIVVTLMAICGFSYSFKLAAELAKGKSSKKAFLDATKKVSWITVDLSVISLIAGIFIFLLGNNYLTGCGIVLFFGSLINLLIQFIINGSSLYFLTTSTFGMNKHELLTSQPKPVVKASEEVEAVETVEVPAEENKPTETPKKKTACIFGSIFGVIVLACTLGLSIFSGVSTPYSETTTFKADSYAYVYVKKTEGSTSLNTPDKVKDVLKTIKYGIEEAGEMVYSDIYAEIETNEYTNYTNPDDSADSTQFTYYIYSVKLNNEFDLTGDTFYVVTLDAEGKVTNAAAPTSLHEALVYSFGDNTVTLNIIEDFDITKTYNLAPIALVTFVSIAVIGVYFFVRYGRFIAIIGVSTSAGVATIALGLFSLLRTAVFNYIAYAAIPAAIFAAFIVAFLSIKYKEELNENKVKVVDLEFKRNIAVKSTDMIKNYCAIVGAIIAVCVLPFFGLATPFVSNTFLLILGLVLFTYLFVAMMYNGYLIKLYDKLGKINFTIKRPKSNKKRLKQQHKARQRGREVEEATFIGIND